MKKEAHYNGYSFLKAVFGFLFKVFYRPKIINSDVIPDAGPIIICGNHLHAFDQFNVIIATKRMLHYMAKKEYFDGEATLFGKPNKITNGITKWAVETAGCIPVNRAIKDDSAKEAAIEVLNNGYALGLFPEGTRNKTNDFLLPFKFGTVSMAQKTGATIVPFAITGEYKIFKRNHLNIRFGEPFKVSKNEDLAEANAKLFKAVSDLKTEGLKAIKDGKI